jgi:hypothetical protein
LLASCTKFGHKAVELLHIAENKADKSASFLLTLNAEGVKTQSFFDNGSRVHLDGVGWELRQVGFAASQDERQRRSSRRSESNCRPGRTGAVVEGKLSPEAFNRFIRLAVGPEPE